MNIINSFSNNSLKKDSSEGCNASIHNNENAEISTKSAPIAQMESEDDFTSRSLGLNAENEELLFDLNTVAEALKVIYWFLM